MRAKKKPKLIVVFDTNVIYTQAASDLINNEARRIIESNSNHVDLEIEWCIPEVVVGERKFRMIEKANELLPNLQKLEKLLGHKFGISEDTLELHVDNAISKSCEKSKLQKIGTQKNDIDWDDLIDRSVRRLPPFEKGDKEKGFRDAIIAHTFLQLQKSSPKTPSTCRLALVTSDNALHDYVEEKVKKSNNVKILKNLNELESLINLTISTIPEELAIKLTEKSDNLFFAEDNEGTLFYKESVRDKLEGLTRNELKQGIFRSNGNLYISSTTFIKKDRQKISWMTVVEIEFEEYHFERDEIEESRLLQTFGNFKNPIRNSIVSTAQRNSGNLGRIRGGLVEAALSQKKVIDRIGKDRFEIHWSTTLSTAQNLTSPKLDKIIYIDNKMPE